MWLGIKPKRTLDLLILNISKGVYVCLAVDVYTRSTSKIDSQITGKGEKL